jgi:hypothetical protein
MFKMSLDILSDLESIKDIKQQMSLAAKYRQGTEKRFMKEKTEMYSSPDSKNAVPLPRGLRDALSE